MSGQCLYTIQLKEASSLIVNMHSRSNSNLTFVFFLQNMGQLIKVNIQSRRYMK